ncbi:hypothetical protein [Frondihabitans australicus]|uniref:Uncharacterized protein n=1 Tax=Frondihabitans australicus TaxID=386892 RepID=A0A495IFT9_9MICO|nr:hypothetical protein [Frondihabitans australicus]RKR74201.1 hypothetical protein C8E83_1309 [Frondihabitans australicus]
MNDPRDIASTLTFAQSVHADDEPGRFSELLRNVADTVDGLGRVDVHDMTFRQESTPQGDFLTISVYYDRLDGPDLRIVPIHGD